MLYHLTCFSDWSGTVTLFLHLQTGDLEVVGGIKMEASDEAPSPNSSDSESEEEGKPRRKKERKITENAILMYKVRKAGLPM